jgi:hypothetical protein
MELVGTKERVFMTVSAQSAGLSAGEPKHCKSYSLSYLL